MYTNVRSRARYFIYWFSKRKDLEDFCLCPLANLRQSFVLKQYVGTTALALAKRNKGNSEMKRKIRSHAT